MGVKSNTRSDNPLKNAQGGTEKDSTGQQHMHSKKMLFMSYTKQI